MSAVPTGVNSFTSMKREKAVRGGVKYLSAQDAVHHDNDEAFQGIEDSKEDLEECGAPVGDGEDGRHPCEGQEGQNHAGAPQGGPAGAGGGHAVKFGPVNVTRKAVHISGKVMLQNIRYCVICLKR